MMSEDLPPVVYGGRVLARPRKFKQVARILAKEVAADGQLPNFAWKVVLGFLADCPRALVSLYSCSVGLHALVVNTQNELFRLPLDAATAHLVAHEISYRGLPDLADPSDEFGDVLERLEEKIKEYEEACLAKSLEARIHGRDWLLQAQNLQAQSGDSFGLVKTVNPRLVRACAATLPAWTIPPGWTIENHSDVNEVLSPRPLGTTTSPIQMHEDTDENGDPICAFQVRYRDCEPTSVLYDTEGRPQVKGTMRDQEGPDDDFDYDEDDPIQSTNLHAPGWWLHYLALRILEPRGYVMNGYIAWMDQTSDAGLIEVIDNRVDIFPVARPPGDYLYPDGLLRYASKHKLLPLWSREDVDKLDLTPGTAFDVSRFCVSTKNKVRIPGLEVEEARRIQDDFERYYSHFEEFMESKLPRLLRYPDFFHTLKEESEFAAVVGGLRLIFAPAEGLPRKRARIEDNAGASRLESVKDGAIVAGAKEATSQADDAKHAT